MIIIIVLINRISPQVFYKYTKRRAAYSKINIMRNNIIIVVVRIFCTGIIVSLIFTFYCTLFIILAGRKYARSRSKGRVNKSDASIGRYARSSSVIIRNSLVI